MEELRNRIIDQIENEDLEISDQESLFNEIRNLPNKDDQIELFNFFVSKLQEEFKTWELTNEELQENIDEIRESLKNYGGLSELEIEELFNKNDFNVDAILSDEYEVEPVVEEDREIVKIDKRIAELAAQLDGKTIEELEKEKSDKTRELNEQIKELEGKQTIAVDRSSKTIEELKKELKDAIYERDNNYALTRKSDITEEEKAIATEKNKEYGEIVKKLTIIVNDRESKGEYANKTLEELKKELKIAIYERDNNYALTRKSDITEEEKAIATEKYKEYGEIAKKLTIIVNDRESNGEYVNKTLEELKKQQKELQSEYDKKINTHKELENLKEIKDAYYSILNDTMEKLESTSIEDDGRLKENIDFLVNEHELINELNKYENADKLKQELKEDIYNNLRVKRVDKKEENKKIFYKALAGAAGFAAGLAASAVPGVGTIRMGIAATKLAASAVNVWTKKHPEGKIAKIKDNFKEKHPKITNAIKKMKEKIKSDPLKWAINGFAAGYITGNVIEMVTGESIWEHLKPEPEPEPDPIAYEPEPEPEPPIPEPEEITINKGDVLDISGLDKGLVSSYSNDYVDLLNEVGKNVEVDKFNVVNGETMVHFKQLNGEGYAWFKLKDVQELLAKAATKAGSKTL